MDYVNDKVSIFPKGFWEKIYEYNKAQYEQEAIDPLSPTVYPMGTGGRTSWETHTVPRYG